MRCRRALPPIRGGRGKIREAVFGYFMSQNLDVQMDIWGNPCLRTFVVKMDIQELTNE